MNVPESMLPAVTQLAVAVAVAAAQGCRLVHEDDDRVLVVNSSLKPVGDATVIVGANPGAFVPDPDRLGSVVFLRPADTTFRMRVAA